MGGEEKMDRESLNRLLYLPLYHVINVDTGNVDLATTKIKECAEFMKILPASAHKALRTGSTSLSGHKLVRVREGFTIHGIRLSRLRNDNYRLYQVYDWSKGGILVFEHYSVQKCAQFVGISPQGFSSAVIRHSKMKKNRYTVEYLDITREERKEFQFNEYARRNGLTE